MAGKSFVFRENWVGSKVTGIKTTFFAILDPTWAHILAPKGQSQIMNSLNRILVFSQLEKQKLYILLRIL